MPPIHGNETSGAAAVRACAKSALWSTRRKPARRRVTVLSMSLTHRKMLERVLADPVNGAIECSRIESLLKAAGCGVVEGAGSSVTFGFNGRKMPLHWPHPGKQALRYRVLVVSAAEPIQALLTACRYSGDASVASIADLSFSRTAAGRPLGATSPY